MDLILKDNEDKPVSKTKKYVLKKSNTVAKFKIDYEKELNQAQYQAVTATKGPVLVIAGAGTGKTRTLVYRVARMVEMGIKPENILLLTFTRKAAQEMMNRASVILDSRCENIAGGTFHSFSNLILRKYASFIGLKNSFTILDKSDSEDLINLIRGQVTDVKKVRFPRKKTIGDIYSKAINKGKSINEIVEEEYPHFSKFTDQIILICKKFAEYKKANSLLDYDDLLLYLKLLLTTNEEIRNKISNTYKYIMIDEYQDTNSIQSDIVKLLASCHNNVMAVGDDSQSIYSFRGANFRNILEFPDIFENTQVIKLEENYRSTQQILDLTNEIIKYSKEKYTKHLFTNNQPGEFPAIIAAPDQQVESEFISQRVIELCEEGYSLNDIAVLARSARATYHLELELNKKGIPFKKYGGFKFIETAHIKDIIAHLRIVSNKQDQISWNRVLLLISGIGNATTNKLIPLLATTDNKIDSDLPLNSSKKANVLKLLELINKLRAGNYSPAEAVQFILNYYKPILTEKYDDYNKREGDLENFLYLSESYNSIENFLTDLALEPPNASFSEVGKVSEENEYLTLSTIHSAKGLEWGAVFIMGAVEGRFPSVYSYSSDDELDEERRLMYVATTRAKSCLHITYPIDMFDYATNMVLSEPSRFVNQIPDNLLDRWCLVEEE